MPNDPGDVRSSGRPEVRARAQTDAIDAVDGLRD
jgi:hypothetical protein